MSADPPAKLDETLAYVLTGLFVLRNMCARIGLDAGRAQAEAMIQIARADLKRHAPYPFYPAGRKSVVTESTRHIIPPLVLSVDVGHEAMQEIVAWTAQVAEETRWRPIEQVRPGSLVVIHPGEHWGLGITCRVPSSPEAAAQWAKDTRETTTFHWFFALPDFDGEQ